MATSEIEKLERRYAENPHGLTFAPLAEVHRKNGDVARALELLTAGLELHPNYIPASIVLGRCHQDLGDLPSAEAAFAHVLRLDDENVIALKSLADINERLERLGEAESWLRRLVAVDRSNDEARDQLRRLETRQKETQVAPEPAVVSAPALEVIELDSKPAAKSPKQADLLPVDIAALELSQAAAEMARRLEATPPVTEATATPVPDAAATGRVESAAAAASAPEPEEPVPGERVPPVAGLISAEFVPPLEAIGGLGVETSEEVVLEVSGSSEFRVPDASEDFRDSFRASADRASAEPKPVVATPSADEEQTIGLPATRRSYVASETKGRSVASFFHSLLAARPPGRAGSSGGGTGSQADRGVPPRPAHDGGFPSSLAGDDNRSVPPAVPAADPKADGAVSFDDFFGSEKEGSTPLRQRADPGKDDLDEFQSWLQNLKR